MRITPPMADIDLYEDGFADHDLLKRKSIGDQLSDLINKVDEPLVIAMDGPWGSGKSFFLKCWVGEHQKAYESGSTLVFFDAFENDYLDDPFTGLTGLLAERFIKTSEKTGAKEQAIAALKKLKGPAARIAIAIATSGLSEVAAPVFSGAFETAKDLTDQQIEKYWSQGQERRNAVRDFRSNLSILTEPNKESIPSKRVIIVVDELDRCRPDFALQTLEIVKHFFSVPGVHFVLGVNIDELMNSVRARYGEGIDARTYIEKFITVSMRLPEDVVFEPHRSSPAASAYFDTKSKEMNLPEKTVKSVQWWRNNFKEFEFSSIRQSQRVLTEIALLPNNDDILNRLNVGCSHSLAFIILVKHMNQKLYSKLRKNDPTYGEIKDLLKPSKEDSEGRHAERLATYIWQSILVPEPLDQEGNLSGVWGTWGLESPKELIPGLFRDFIDPIQLIGESQPPKP